MFISHCHLNFDAQNHNFLWQAVIKGPPPFYIEINNTLLNLNAAPAKMERSTQKKVCA